MGCLLFRADAGAAMGIGHVMRCKALAEAVMDGGGRAVFVMASPPPMLRSILADADIAIHILDCAPATMDDARRTLAVAAAERADAIVADGYHFDVAYLEALHRQARLALLDDLADRPRLPCDAVINPSLAALRMPYPDLAPGARLLLGPSHALIRRDVRMCIGTDPFPPSQRKSLVLTFGGSDPVGLTVPVAAAILADLPPGVVLDVVVGPANPLAAEALGPLAHNPAVRLHVNPPSVGPVFAAAGLAVTAGGGTVGELMALGIPALVAVTVANQETAGEGCPYPCRDARHPHAARHLAAEALRLWRSPAERDRMAALAAAALDGEGAVRVVRALLSLPVPARSAR